MCERFCTANFLFYFAILFLFPHSWAYLVLINENQQPGDVIFNASVYKLGSERHYHINTQRSARFVADLIDVDSEDGVVKLRERLECENLYYPSLFTLHVESTSSRLRDIDYYSLPLRIFIVGNNCDKRNEDKHISLKISEAKHWISETYASFAIPTTDRWQKICLRQSQFINSIKAFLPKTITEYCSVEFFAVSDDRFEIERTQGDLVASRDVCITEPLWKVVVSFNAYCHDVGVVDSEHRLKIVYHHQQFNDTDIAKRVRRELKNQSPFFEQHLYVASVLEECDPGVVVTTVKARDPENSPVTYSMTSLLDARTQSMFDIDSTTGTITTRVKLDRELVDVHYFKVTAVNSFPPRSGTTMLQINVLDANDHSPMFEMNEYDANVRESVTVGTTVITLKATDQDVGKNAEVEYTIESINGGGTSTEEEDSKAFKIDGKSGVITTRTSLDREVTEVYTLIVQASDMATPQSARRSST